MDGAFYGPQGFQLGGTIELTGGGATVNGIYVADID